MITTVKRICTINARGGSKGVPNKNLTLVCGIPLIAHSIIQAKESGKFDVIAVSSDSEEILNVSASLGAQVVRRPAELADDDAPKVPSIIHCVKTIEKDLGFEFDFVVDLDATSPLREQSDIIGVVETIETGRYESVFTACASRRSPFFNQVMRNAAGVWGPVIRESGEFFRRQDAPRTFDMNASIYAWKRASLITGERVFFESTAMYEMPEERSWDIDSYFDLRVVTYLMESKMKEVALAKV